MTRRSMYVIGSGPNPAFNRTRRKALFFLGERLWRRTGYRER